MLAMTPNQLILLLQTYRRILDRDKDWELITEQSYGEDMRFLFKNGMISFDGTLHITPKGMERVMQAIGEID